MGRDRSPLFDPNPRFDATPRLFESSLEKTRFEAQSATMEDLFPLFLVPGIALVALEALLRLLVVRRFP